MPKGGERGLQITSVRGSVEKHRHQVGRLGSRLQRLKRESVKKAHLAKQLDPDLESVKKTKARLEKFKAAKKHHLVSSGVLNEAGSFIRIAEALISISSSQGRAIGLLREKISALEQRTEETETTLHNIEKNLLKECKEFEAHNVKRDTFARVEERVRIPADEPLGFRSVMNTPFFNIPGRDSAWEQN
jgi:prefoldin subunit 5